MVSTLWRALRRLCAAIGLLYLLVTLTPMVRWWGLLLADKWTDGDAPVLIVLTGSSLGPAVMGESSYRRTVYAVLAERQHPYREIWITGAGGTEAPVARLMADFLVSHGIDRAKIHLETDSQTTRESGERIRTLLSGAEAALLSSDYHMYRAVRVFARAGLPVRPLPAPDALKRAEHWDHRWSAFIDLTAETIKIVYYRVRGWI
jgi:uncharacterized SAM-binding protein YcdF (DUF218 family)